VLGLCVDMLLRCVVHPVRYQLSDSCAAEIEEYKRFMNLARDEISSISSATEQDKYNNVRPPHPILAGFPLSGACLVSVVCDVSRGAGARLSAVCHSCGSNKRRSSRRWNPSSRNWITTHATVAFCWTSPAARRRRSRAQTVTTVKRVWSWRPAPLIGCEMRWVLCGRHMRCVA